MSYRIQIRVNDEWVQAIRFGLGSRPRPVVVETLGEAELRLEVFRREGSTARINPDDLDATAGTPKAAEPPQEGANE